MTAFDEMVLRRLRRGPTTVEQLMPWLERHYDVSRHDVVETLCGLRDSGHATCRGTTRWEATTLTS